MLLTSWIGTLRREYVRASKSILPAPQMTLSDTPGLREDFSKLHREFLQGVYSGDKPSMCVDEP